MARQAIERRTTIKGYQCLYCGETATTLDHFPPRSYSDWGLLLPACGECNGLAGTEYPTDFERRFSHVRKRLMSRYRKYLDIPDLMTDDYVRGRMHNTSGKLKRWLIASILTKRRAQRRLAWNVAAYLAVIDHNNAFAATNAEILASLGVVPRSTADTKIE